MNVILVTILCLCHAVYIWLRGLVLCCFPRSYRFKDVSRDIALVTGAGSGIGRLMAIQIASLGATVVCWDINKEGNDETVREIEDSGGKAKGYICDVSSREAIYRSAAQVKEEVGKVTILINNAGVVTGKSLLDCPDHMIQRTFEVNSLALFWTTKAFLPDMIIGDRGHIVTIASIAGHIGAARLTDYCASKFAAVGYHYSLIRELESEGHNINTTLVCPYYINTGMFDGVQSNLFPVLDPHHVANEVVSAMLSNQRELYIPKYMYHVALCSRLFPYEVISQAYRRTNIDKFMDTFIGRLHIRSS